VPSTKLIQTRTSLLFLCLCDWMSNSDQLPESCSSHTDMGCCFAICEEASETRALAVQDNKGYGITRGCDRREGDLKCLYSLSF
jgi:hypothetical protein